MELVFIFSKYSDNIFINGLVIMHNPSNINMVVILFRFRNVVNKSLINILDKRKINDITLMTDNNNFNYLVFELLVDIFFKLSFIDMWLKHDINILYRLKDSTYKNKFLEPTI